ncbi:hypothetical protein NKI88_31390 [Mesorhizobium sp. M0317]|uniref:hypothetical protein n=1 Tax=Mesorhizobium sp. M0317 TaxID=2956935 RepID=UPI003339E5B9
MNSTPAIRRDAGQTPLGEFEVFARKACERSTFDALKQLPATDAQPTHDVIIDALECLANGGIGLGQREEGLVAQPPRMHDWAKRTPFSTFNPSAVAAVPEERRRHDGMPSCRSCD